MKKTLVLIVSLIVAILMLISCAAGDAMVGDYDYGYAPGIGATGTGGGFKGSYAEVADSAVEAMPVDDPADMPSAGVEEPGKDVTNNYNAGIITAAAHNDNDYYQMWLDLFSQNEENPGKFNVFTKNNWGFNPFYRLVVTVKDGENAVSDAKISFESPSGYTMTARTDVNGVAYIFRNSEKGTLTVAYGENADSVEVESTDQSVEVNIAGGERSNLIELMFMVDVTGSMADELEYLKSELADVVERVSKLDEQVHINMAFLFYRDRCDREMFNYVDFKDVTNPDDCLAQLKQIAKVYANGGGDYEEAVDEALELAVSKQWSSNSTKILFHVLDAPPHSGKEYQERFNKAVMAAAAKGIRICPIIASGANDVCEYLMRTEAVYTGGTFVFITDHSGIGGTHHDPEIPNVVVEHLNLLMVRLIKGYYTGTFEAPVPYNSPKKAE